MSCCGKTREAMRRPPSRWARSATPPTPPPGSRVPILYTGSGAYLVAGPSSGEIYHFTTRQPRQWVDAGDAPALVRTGLFQAEAR